MIFWRNPLRFILFALLLIPAVSFGQFFPRLEIGFNYITATGNYNGTTQVLDGGGQFAGDTTMKRNLTGTGIGGDIGSTIRLKKVGHTNMWALSIHVIFNQITYTNLNETYGLSGSYTVNNGNNLNCMTTQIGVPVAIEYKLGPDAILSKRLHVGASFGLGVMPSYNATTLVNTENISGNSSATFGFTPLAKAEVAFFAGLCFKIRGQFSFGNIPLLDQKTALAPLTDGPFKVTNTSNLMISFIIMPGSIGWKETAWDNTFDTYNPYER